MRRLNHLVLLLVLIAIVVACQSTRTTGLLPDSPSFHIDEYRSKFPHAKIQVFNQSTLKDLSIDTPVFFRHYPILRDLAIKVYQDSILRDVENETTKVLYAIQEEKRHQGILIAGTDDDWVNRVIYHSYNHKGKLIGKLVLYESGGDGEFSTYSSGEFINDRIYVRRSINCGPIDDGLETIKCDTASFKFRIHRDGKIDTLASKRPGI